MSGQFLSGIKKYLHFAIIIIVSLLITWLFSISGILNFWDKVFYDHLINHRVFNGSETKGSRIVTIDLNDSSIKELGSLLDTRQAFADVMEVIADTNVNAVLDFLFLNEKEKEKDTVFVNALGWVKDTVVAVLAVNKDLMELPNSPYMELKESEKEMLQKHIWNIKVLDKGKIPQAGSFFLPFPALLDAAGHIGHINMEPDSDGIYRRVPLLYEWDGGYIPSLALAAGVMERGIKVENIELKAGFYLSLPVNENEIIYIPIDDKGRMLIPYTDSWANDTNRISFSTLVDAKKEEKVFDDISQRLNILTIALLAEISTSQKDFGPTSFERLYPLSGIHAEVLSGILNGFNNRAFIRWASLPFKLISLLLIICIAFICIKLQKDILFHLGFLFIFVFFSCLALFRWHSAAISPWFAFPVTLIFFLWLSEFLSRLFVRYREQLLLKNALSRYFPHALAQRIIRERKTELLPAYKELTILFSDIAGFTKWSSDKSPKDVHDFLSDYLESMAEILFSHGGTVDKFMGDGILAFFGDPFDMPNHTEHCIKAAIAMQKKAQELAVKWKPLVDVDLNVRIGINTGKVIVGNLGNKTRIEYTVIGAAVNLAQRMESNAPLGGILVTADVREKVEGIFSFPERIDVKVKGYDEAIEAYVVGETIR